MNSLQNSISSFRWPIAAFLALIVIDVTTKEWATQQGWSQLNTGVSFGLGSEYTSVGWILVTAVILVWLTVAWWRESDRWRWPLTWLIAGGFGNLLDRVVWGGVRDWIPLWHTGISNNAADWFIAIGLGWWFAVWYISGLPRS